MLKDYDNHQGHFQAFKHSKQETRPTSRQQFAHTLHSCSPDDKVKMGKLKYCLYRMFVGAVGIICMISGKCMYKNVVRRTVREYLGAAGRILTG